MRLKRKLAALACALSLLTGPVLAAGEGYPDVSAGDWFAPAVQEMTEKGVMTGLADGRFAPYAVVDRATVVTVLWRLAGAPAATVAKPFPDAVDTWYDTAAAWAKGRGIATGYA
ncbi:MAG: S-layer homology domain-containing protein, partial [Lachnospirales bacterium]